MSRHVLQIITASTRSGRKGPAVAEWVRRLAHREWADKPAGVVSYGGVSAGLRAATALKPVLAALRMVPVVEAVSIPFFTQFLAEDGTFVPNAELEAGAKTMLDELARLTAALRPLRAAA
jgi:NAD(P)H-dependent FMN reductase